MRLTKILLTLSVASLLWPLAALADDTDIYINNTPVPLSAPLVMFSVDYRSNLNANICSNVNSGCPQADYFRANGLAADMAALVASGGSMNFFDVLRLSLKIVLQQVSGVKIGLMFNHNDAGNNCIGYSATPNCSNGGTMLMGFELLSATDSFAARTKFLAKLDKLKALKPAPSSTPHPYQGAELFFEFFRYLTGQGIYNGHNGWVDFENGNSDTTSNTNPTGIYAPASWDDLIETGTSYRSPLLTATSCTKIFTINFMFQVSQAEANSEAAMFAAKTAGGTGVTKPSSQGDYFPAILRFLNQADLSDSTYGTAGNLAGAQNVISYFFIDDRFINNTTREYATTGGTNNPYALGNDPGKLVSDLLDVFQQILSVSTTFVSASIPVNVFNRASFVDNVYIALFQADADAKPSWNGNIKKLKIKQNRLTDGSVNTFFSDALDQPAIDIDGRIKNGALTYWTTASALSAPGTTDTFLAGKDGREVPRGGAGQKIPGFVSGSSPGAANTDTGARKLFYDSSSTALTALNADSTTATALRTSLAAATDTEALALLRYARGLQSTGTAARPWIFGDPLHSRPLPINYGARGTGYSTTNPAIYVAVASNDGYLRFIRNTNADASESGQEVWGFMPRRVMPVQKLLLANTQITDAGVNKHPYTFDGAPVSYSVDVNGNGTIEGDGTTTGTDRAYLFAGLRRGGSAYYGLNVTNPDSPTLMWTISDVTGGDFTEMGLSFSTPKIGTVLVGTTVTPALFFAGGYDGNKDAHALGTNDTKGRAIYVVNAVTGALIWKSVYGATAGFNSTTKAYSHAGMLDSIPSDLAIADSDGDASGLIDRILVADTGGKVWRVDLTQDGVIANWKTTVLASLGRHVTNTKTNDRRFFYPPDIVQSRDGVGNYDAVILGSGDREDPLDKGGATSNYLYVIKDRAIRVGDVSDRSTTQATLTDVSSNCLQGGVTETCNPDLNTGWKLALTQAAGEKSLAPAVTFSGAISFNTYLPSTRSTTSDPLSCGPSEGSGLRYVLSLKNGTAVQNLSILDGGSTSVYAAPNSSADRFETLRSAGIPGQSVFISTPFGVKEIPPDNTPRDASGTSRFKTFWQRQQRN